MIKILNIKVARGDVFNKYRNMQSKETQEEIIRYEPLPKNVSLPKGANRDNAIKIIFKSYWLRVYEVGKEINWY